MMAPILLSVAAMIAGKPVNVACDSDTNFGPTGPPAPGFAVEGWTLYGGDTVHMLPQLCDGVNSIPGTIEFASGIRVLIHESAHARGYKREACAELVADEGIYQVLRDLWSIPFFSDLSRKIGAQILSLTRLRPGNYQPENCWDTSSS